MTRRKASAKGGIKQDRLEQLIKTYAHKSPEKPVETYNFSKSTIEELSDIFDEDKLADIKSLIDGNFSKETLHKKLKDLEFNENEIKIIIERISKSDSNKAETVEEENKIDKTSVLSESQFKKISSILLKDIEAEDVTKDVFDSSDQILKYQDPEHIEISDMELSHLLEQMITYKASELHIIPDSPPYLRINGVLEKSNLGTLSQEKAKEIIFQSCSEKQLETLENYGEIIFTYSPDSSRRFQVILLKHHNGYGGIFKQLSLKALNFKQLNLPAILGRIALYKSGIVIITGPSGSGKTSTMTSVIDYINQNRKSLVVTVENITEFAQESKKSIVISKETGSKLSYCQDALKKAIHKEPDVIFIGEDLQDEESAAMALKASEMGALVFCSLHLTSTTNAIKRFIDLFPPEKSLQIATRLSIVLKAVLAQKLLPGQDGKILITEVLLNTRDIADAIRKGHFNEISSIIFRSRKSGMQTMKQSLAELVKKGIITSEELSIFS